MLSHFICNIFSPKTARKKPDKDYVNFDRCSATECLLVKCYIESMLEMVPRKILFLFFIIGIYIFLATCCLAFHAMFSFNQTLYD